MIRKIEKPPLVRKWYECPRCGKKLVLYDNASSSMGVYIKCRGCGTEVEIRI